MKTVLWMVLAASAGMLSTVPARADHVPDGPVAPQAMWWDGLEKIGGKFQFVQIASPGGLWQEDTIVELVKDPSGPIVGKHGERYKIKSRRVEQRQVSINELKPSEREMLLAATIEISAIPVGTPKTASQNRSPGPRGSAPYHGMLRFYEEIARGHLVMRGLPGVGLADGDNGTFEGDVEYALNSACHSDPSDVGVFKERFDAEMIWGAAAQSRNYANLEATKLVGASPSELPEDAIMANARLLRGGREIVSYVDWSEKAGPEGAGLRRIRGSVRLFRVN